MTDQASGVRQPAHRQASMMPALDNKGYILLLAILPILAGIIVFSALTRHQTSAILAEQARFGESTARQLAEQVASIVVEKDVLSLNVLVTRLTREEPLRYVAVYDDRNHLIAQSGKEIRGDPSYTSEITFQDSLVGRVRVVVQQASHSRDWLTAMLILAAVGYGFAVWHFGAMIMTRVSRYADATEQPDNLEQVPPGIADGPSEECILVVRIRPARYLERHFNKFFEAASLYGGIVEQTTTEELVIHFDCADALYMAACSGLLIRQIAASINGKISFGGTLDLLDEKPETIRKEASYLASIAGGALVLAGGRQLLADRVKLQTFHHALIDSGQLLTVQGLSDPGALDDQARLLLAEY